MLPLSNNIQVMEVTKVDLKIFSSELQPNEDQIRIETKIGWVFGIE